MTYIEKGKELIYKELRRRSISQSDFFVEENINGILKDMPESNQLSLF